ncbi:hypothetical protein CTEN210_12030 [Chaetoceros tenuissimus]|uniref:Uncharacterized protein n=1 Tax=Chaetoceros tenuissimus TaxID=426638 RepID=A0AAD3D0R2_9STRA|nr:hypothetical protein CTEN210_12030 [Chaetoceros tenuissimus]
MLSLTKSWKETSCSKENYNNIREKRSEKEVYDISLKARSLPYSFTEGTSEKYSQNAGGKERKELDSITKLETISLSLDEGDIENHKKDIEQLACRRTFYRLSSEVQEQDMVSSWKDKTEKTDIKRDSSMIVKMAKAVFASISRKDWMFKISWTIFALFVAFISQLGVFFPDTPRGTGSTCSTNDAGVKLNIVLCDMIESANTASARINILTAFILSAFASRELWLTKRTAYCALCGATRNLLINICSLVRNKDDRETMVRWSVLGYELSVLKGRDLVDTEVAENFLESMNLIDEDEWDVLVDGDRHTTVWFWIQLKATHIFDDGCMTDLQLQTICNAVTLSRDKANDLMSKLDRNQPPPFILLCALLVNLTLFMDSLSVGLTWGKIFHEAKGHPYHIYLELFMFLLYSVLLGLFFDICTILYNPFGPRDIDIPHHLVGKGIRQLGMELSKRETPITFDRQVNMRRRFSTLGGSLREAETLAFDGMKHAMQSNMKRQKQHNQFDLS